MLVCAYLYIYAPTYCITNHLIGPRNTIIPLLDSAVISGCGRCQDVFGCESLYGCSGALPQGMYCLDEHGGGGRSDHWGRSLASSGQQSLNLKRGAALIIHSFIHSLQINFKNCHIFRMIYNIWKSRMLSSTTYECSPFQQFSDK